MMFKGHVAGVGTKRIHKICWWENRMRKYHLGYLGLSVAIIFILILKKEDKCACGLGSWRSG
jgi:hypothetical protein